MQLNFLSLSLRILLDLLCQTSCAAQLVRGNEPLKYTRKHPFRPQPLPHPPTPVVGQFQNLEHFYMRLIPIPLTINLYPTSNVLCAGAGATWPGAYFRSHSDYSITNWVWSDRFVYKLFPDVMAFYLFVSAIFVISAIAHGDPSFKLRLHRRIWVI